MLHVVFILSVKASIFLEFLTKLLCPHQLVIPYINLFFCEPFFGLGQSTWLLTNQSFSCVTNSVLIQIFVVSPNCSLCAAGQDGRISSAEG